MTDFGFDDVEEDETTYDIKKAKKASNSGYLSTPKRSAPWQCDCIAGNPRPGVIVNDPRLHDIGCPVRKRCSGSWIEKVDIFGNEVNF